MPSARQLCRERSSFQQSGRSLLLATVVSTTKSDEVLHHVTLQSYHLQVTKCVSYCIDPILRYIGSGIRIGVVDLGLIGDWGIDWDLVGGGSCYEPSPHHHEIMNQSIMIS